MDQKIKLLEEIDLARCRAQWSIAIELSKKYKKSNPNDSVLDTTIQTEVELIRLLKSKIDTEKRGWDIIHQHDTPSNITLLPIIDPKKVQPLAERLINCLDSDKQANQENWQAQFTKILLARIYFESGQYQEALDALQNLALRMEDVQMGYGLVLLVQARAIKGVCLEKKGEFEAAIEAYESAWNAVELKPQERGIMLSFWIEDCLYRGCLLRLKLNHPAKETLNMMRAYIQLVSSYWSPRWRMFKRWVIFKFYTEYLVTAYQNNTYCVPSTTAKNSNSTNSSLTTELAAFEELSTLMALYRHLFTLITPHLSTSNQANYSISLAHIMMNSHDVIGWGEINHIRRVLQFLYQVKNATFNHPTVIRYMFYTLMRLGSVEEARYALRAYLDLMGVPQFESDAVTAQPATSYAKITCIRADCLFKKLSECNDETPETVIQVILAGIYLYGHEEQNGQLTTYLSELCLGFLQLIIDHHNLALGFQAEVHRVRGSSYTLLATQTDDPIERAAHHQIAILSFKKAIELNLTDWKSHYGLGLQLALMHNVPEAIESVRRSIEINPDHADSWHLMALLYSCKMIDNLAKAKEALEAGLAISAQQQSTYSGFHLPAYSWTSPNQVNINDTFEKAESYLSMKMTRLALIEAMHGAEETMEHYEDLYATYIALSQSLGVTSNGNHYTSVVANMTSTEEAAFQSSLSTISDSSTTSRRKSSSFSLIRRTSFTSSIANSITGGTSVRSSREGSFTGRPRSSSVESNTSRPSSSQVARRAESDTEDAISEKLNKRSDHSHRHRKRHHHSVRSHASLHRSNSSITQQEEYTKKKKNLQMIDLGLARRIGTAVASTSQHSNHRTALSATTETLSTNRGSSSLASMFSPSYSKGSLRSNSLGSRRSSASSASSVSSMLLNSYQHKKAVTRDGLIVSTFFQHHQIFEARKRTRWHSLLVTLWLMSTKTFIKAGLLEEANKALSEAEQLGLGDPNVWYQLAQLSLQVHGLLILNPKKANSELIQEMKQVALDACEKALILDPEHLPSQVAQAKRLLEDGHLEMADVLLGQITMGLGWNSSEAWYHYAQVKKQQGQWDKMKSYLLFALEINDSEPVRDYVNLSKFLK
ncbi:MAG: hypothetical protein EXX96DRAFT_553180 [Benjaminiella poitrasii]|nr:MAG: hypothetical protein EXX96DRAFT_553180 [Benjaminiella poitrasii]